MPSLTCCCNDCSRVKLFMGLLYLGGPTIQEVGVEITMGLSIYRVAVIDGSLYSRFYGIVLNLRIK